MNKILKALFLPLVLFFAHASYGQMGHYLILWGGPQLTTMNNFYDYNVFVQGNNLDRVTTYRAAAGLDYVINFDTSYGFQTGVIYSQEGQKYAGLITRDYNTKKNDTANFESHVYINYFRVPLMFRFNSPIDPDERMNMSLFMGFSLNFLQGVQEVYTSPPAPESVLDTFSSHHPDFNFNNLYKKVGLGIGAGVQMNIRITQNFGTLVGVRFDRTLGSVENLDYAYPKDVPVEYIFPVSTKKESPTDLLTRAKTNNTVVNVFIGLSYRLVKPHER